MNDPSSDSAVASLGSVLKAPDRFPSPFRTLGDYILIHSCSERVFPSTRKCVDPERESLKWAQGITGAKLEGRGETLPADDAILRHHLRREVAFSLDRSRRFFIGMVFVANLAL